jgi:hypothetical protein
MTLCIPTRSSVQFNAALYHKQASTPHSITLVGRCHPRAIEPRVVNASLCARPPNLIQVKKSHLEIAEIECSYRWGLEFIG